MQGAADMRQRVLEAPYEENPSLQYAACRNLLLEKEKKLSFWQIMNQASLFF